MGESARFINRRAKREVKRRTAWYRYPDYWLVFVSGSGFGGFLFMLALFLLLWMLD